MIEQAAFARTIDILQTLDVAPAPSALQRDSARRAFLQRAAALRAARSSERPFARLVRLSAAGLAGLALALGGLTGAAHAANDALPGDFLYALDRAEERVSLLLAGTPDEVLLLRLAIADERLHESEQLAAQGDQVNMAVALDAYGSAISALAKTVAEGHGAQQEVDLLVNEALTAQEQRLLLIREQLPAQALPGLDRAIEAAQQAQQERMPAAPDDNDDPPGHRPSPRDPKNGKDKPHGRPDQADGPS